MNKSSSMQTIGNILIGFNPLEDKYISREFQSYGYYLCEQLNDMKHKSLYMRLAKTVPRALLEKALSFVKDANVKRKGALFMWKLKTLGAWDNNGKNPPAHKASARRRKKAEDIPF
ncbi:hypothetical protein HY338_04145 [Candidatus Gottesmanbacteria bacterium]|nr:hypothetical protein [Candidatus Gottesmanbacteria bacterium]